MKCPECSNPVPSGARFCAFCGIPVRTCLECELVWPGEAVFCGACGGSLVTKKATPPEEALFENSNVIGILFEPQHPERQFVLVEGEMTIGAGDKNNIVIDRPAVSWLHALMIVRPDRVRIQDSASTNGTYINDVRVNRPYEVKHGDLLRFGNVELKVWLRPQIRG